MNVSDNITLTYIYGAGDKEFVFCCKNRPFAVLCSSSLPTPAASLIDHNLVMELGLKITDLQCKKISFAGRKLRLLGKISTTVQCIKDGKLFANIHLRASVVENLKDVVDAHCVAGQKLSMMLDASVPSLDEEDVPVSSPSVSMSSSVSPVVPGTPSKSDLSPIDLSDTTDAAAAAKHETPPGRARAKHTTPPGRARAHRLVVDEGWSPLTANLTAIDEMFGGADIMSDEEEEHDILVKHGQDDPKLVYTSGHGRYKCNLVQCDTIDDPRREVPHNCAYHPAYCLPDKFQNCGEYCHGAFCRCLKFYQT